MSVYCSCAGDFALTIHTKVWLLPLAVARPALTHTALPTFRASALIPAPLLGLALMATGSSAGLHGADRNLPEHCPALWHVIPHGDPGVAAAEEPPAGPLARRACPLSAPASIWRPSPGLGSKENDPQGASGDGSLGPNQPTSQSRKRPTWVPVPGLVRAARGPRAAAGGFCAQTRVAWPSCPPPPASPLPSGPSV